MGVIVAMDRRKRALRRQQAAQRVEETRKPLARDNSPIEMGDEKKGGLFGKVNAVFSDAIQAGRGDDAPGSAAPMHSGGAQASTAPDDLSFRRAKSLRAEKMIVPEGVVIEGAMTSNSDTEIYGTIDGDVTVNSRLYLGPSAKISGSVRASICRIEASVEGGVECQEELELGPAGRLNSDAMAGKKMILAGDVKGNVTCGGLIHALSTAKITGNIRARMIVIDEGAVFNGTCKTVRDDPGSSEQR